ncbi:methyltransferase type 11 protein [Rutstroemia sp. NJR-2017a BBW]|nr:methyltransferase type 11 protein [Rutstroemia sp. NJR-2017a BBW]
MASNIPTFGLPARPNVGVQQRRAGYPIPSQEASRLRDREDESAYIKSRKERRRMNLEQQQQTGLPRPSIRQPSPVPRSKSENSYKSTMVSSLGTRVNDDKNASLPTTALSEKASRNVLRRKPSSISHHIELSRPTTSRATTEPLGQWNHRPDSRPSVGASSKSPVAHNESSLRTRKVSSPAMEAQPKIIPELDRYRPNREHHGHLDSRLAAEIPYKLSTPEISPPTPTFGFGFAGPAYNRYSGYSGSGYSASPSTRFSESPGPSAYSRDTTPTSMSSASPGIVVPFKSSIPSRRGSSPTRSRPPLSRRHDRTPSNEIENPILDHQGLPALRESVNSSSSNSTVKADGKAVLTKEKKKKTPMAPLPPSPPPRKSSQKFKKPTENENSPARPSQSRPAIVPTSPEVPIRNFADGPGGSPARPTPPRRPSRDGAPDLRTQLGDFAILQSNFTGIKYTGDRSDTISPTTSAASPPPTVPRQISREPLPNPSPMPFVSPKREPSPAPTGLGFIPNLRPPSRGHTTRTPSPSVDNGKHRFGFFSRRTKTTPEAGTATAEKPPRRGPAAGTGHEGYTRYALRGRSTGAPAPGRTHERSLSGSSTFVSGTQDPFFRDRINPVVIAGGGQIKENRNSGSVFSRTESNTSLTALSKTSTQTSSTQDPSQPTLWPSAIPKDNSNRNSSVGVPRFRRPSDGQYEDQKKPPLAFRRSMQRLNSSTGALVSPEPLIIPPTEPSSSMGISDSALLSGESQLEMKGETERGRNDDASKPKKLEKRARSPRKWNIFHRQAQKPPVEVKGSPVQVSVGRQPVKAVPHYAMMDSSSEPEDLESLDLEDILRDSNVVMLTDEQLDELQFSNMRENLRRIEELQLAMAPSLPEVMPATTVYAPPEPILPISPEIEIPEPEFQVTREVTPVRPSRLQQVGRIPKVVSARPETTSPKSFSRPFARLSTLQPTLNFAELDADSVALGASPPKPSTLEQDYAAQFDAQRNSQENKSTPGSIQREFLAFSPRKNSACSSGTLNFGEITAVIPDPDAELAEDEVWDEYDDLMETDGTCKSRVSTTSSFGVPFQYETYQSRRSYRPRSSIKTTNPLPMPNRELPEVPPRKSTLTTSSIYSQDMDTTTPISLSDFFPSSNFHFDTTSSNPVHDPASSNTNSSSEPPIPATNRISKNSTHSRKSASSSNTSTSRISGSSLLRISSQESNSPMSQVNLRVGSMTVSKWLTFGNVLFSPAREAISELEGTKRCSILIIDGLGNDDWSYYAAETYPSCNFYNLSPTAAHTASTPAAYPAPPSNHHQVPFPSFTSPSSTPIPKFPFPSSTFSTVIFRFPSTLTTQTYTHLVSESRRVLKPGGYIEITLLDLDMLNMGPRTRRAVRGLKTRLRERDEGVVLGSVGDLVLRLLGGRGWKDVKSCRVGVPVTGFVMDRSKSKAQKQKIREERSLVDMMKDPSPEGDESITKMVAKVGRWWYMRCYESGLLEAEKADARKGKGKQKEKEKINTGSIFSDVAVLEECEKWNASFKLVVVHAQKPVHIIRRRTNSV